MRRVAWCGWHLHWGVLPLGALRSTSFGLTVRCWCAGYAVTPTQSGCWRTDETEAQAVALMDSDTLAVRIFATYCGGSLVLAVLICALSQ